MKPFSSITLGSCLFQTGLIILQLGQLSGEHASTDSLDFQVTFQLKLIKWHEDHRKKKSQFSTVLQ